VDKWLSVAQLAQQAGVPESTTRRYLSRFDRFFRYEERQKGKRYHPGSVPIVTLIKNLYDEAMEAEEIEQVLEKQFPFNASVDDSPAVTQPPTTPLVATKSDLEEVLSEVRAAREEMQAVRQENVELHQLLEQRIAERDKKLVEAMETVLQARKEIASTREERMTKRWWQFWK
jgi:DNA-binding transcriptional MerR regulator